jgi:tetratricopeptide (TPR) repeat protein
MRVLIGPLNRRDHRAVVGDLDGLDVRCFDRHDADVTFDAAHESLGALWTRLPAGFTPEVLIWWSPEYALVPDGIEDCPVPSIAVLGDWNLGVWSTTPLLEAFDWVVTDARGVATFRAQLDVAVDRWRAFSFDRLHHRRTDDVARDIDVLFVGSMNGEVQTERAPWLARLARLSDRHRVLLVSGVYGDAYPALLNRARIVWNRSIRGELNMRAYEAPACGALLLMERENLEVRDVFTDGVSCALYDATDLENQIARYLGRPDRLRRVADAGWRRVQSETYRDHFAALLDRATALGRGPRTFGTWPAWRRDYWLAMHALSVPDGSRIPAAFRHLTRASTRADDPAALTAAFGAVAVAVAVHSEAAEGARAAESAYRMFGEALAVAPEDLVTRMNLASLAGALGRLDDARHAWQRVHEVARSDAPFPLDRVPAPFGYDRFRVEWERASVAADPAERMAALRPVIRARAAAALGGLEAGVSRRAAWWRESVCAAAGVADNQAQLARALDESGHDGEAAETYARALGANPFDDATWRSAVALAKRRGDADTVTRLTASRRELAHAAPFNAPSADELEPLAVDAGDGR